MPQHLKRFIFTTTSLLRPASRNNRVILNFWSPGYKITNPKTKVKEFIPTSTVEVAVSYLTKLYGPKEYLKFKDDVHPGHTALETKSSYLSVGTTDEIENIGVGTTHALVHTDSFTEDVLAFRRFPDKQFDFYVLNSSEIDKAIEQFKTSEKLYSLLGARFNFADGESCATANHLCLATGGIDELLRQDKRLIGRHSILTPALLAEYAEAARNKELTLSAKSVLFSQEFIAEYAELSVELQKQLDMLAKISKEQESTSEEEPEPPTPKKPFK